MKQQVLEAATPVLGLALVRVGEILVEKAHEVGIHDAQEAEELGLEHTPSPNHLALLVSAAWLCDLLGMGGIDFDLLERLSLTRESGHRPRKTVHALRAAA